MGSGIDIDLRLVSELSGTGSALYNERKLESAIRSYQLALDKIRQVNLQYPADVKLLELIQSDKSRISLEDWLNAVKHDCQSMIGTCQAQMGEYLDALATLHPFLSSTDTKERSFDLIFRSLISYAEVAQKIPVTRKKIGNTYMDIERYLALSGKTHHNHEVLVFKSRHHFLCGDLERALENAREAIQRKEVAQRQYRDTSGQVWDFHYDGLITILLAMGHVEEAKREAAYWLERPDYMPLNRLVRRNKCLADIHRSQHMYPESIEFALKAEYYANSSDYNETKFSSFIALFYACYEAGDREMAKKALTEVMKLRSSKRLFIRFHILLILQKLRAMTGVAPRNPFKSSLLNVATEIDTLLEIAYYSSDPMSQKLTFIY